MSAFAAGDARTVQYARIGGLRRAALHDSAAMTANARDAFALKFEREVDPDGLLPPEERVRRAKAAQRAYMAQLALRRWGQSCKTSRASE